MNLIMKTQKLPQHTIAILGIGLFLVLQTGSSLAQQIPNFSMYNMNHYLVNPAATGTTDRVPVSLSYRKMWAGMENTPSIQYLSGNMLVGQDMGVGAKLFNSQIGQKGKMPGMSKPNASWLIWNPSTNCGLISWTCA